jgi:hypothetical protein
MYRGANGERAGRRYRLGVTPEDAAHEAQASGVPTIQRYWDKDAASIVESAHGKASLITACNVFAHSPRVHDFLTNVDALLAPSGRFVVEVGYLGAAIERCHYDTIYGEHLRYYSVESLSALMHSRGWELAALKSIPSHGGSIRAIFRRVTHSGGVQASEPLPVDPARLRGFADEVPELRNELRNELCEPRNKRMDTIGIGAPSRASTIISYCGLGAADVRCVYEIPSSPKVGHCMPGTQIPILAEQPLEKHTRILALNHHLPGFFARYNSNMHIWPTGEPR